MQILYYLESIRTPLLNKLCVYLSMLGEESLLIIVGLILLWCVDKKWGFRYFFIGSMCTGFSRLVKGAWQEQRPFELDPNFSCVQTAESNTLGYSMPSGHCQGAANIYGINAFRVKKTWFTILSAVLIALVAFSRMELGCHTPLDCLVGIAMTLLITYIYVKVFDYVDEDINKLITIAVVSCIILLLIALVLNYIPHSANFREDINTRCIKKTITSIFTLIGVCIGYLIDHRFVHYDVKAPLWAQLVKVVLGVGLLYVSQEALEVIVNALSVDSMISEGIVKLILMTIFSGIYPMTFRLYKRREK